MAPEDKPVAHLNEIIAFRWADYDTPLWVRPNSRAGRFNRASQAATQYWCLDPHAPWAELIRQEEIRTEAEVAMVRMRFWTACWSVGPVADMRTFAKADSWGIDPAVLVDDDHSTCRDLADVVRAADLAGLLCPSAALPEAVSLVVFGPRIAVGWHAEPRLASGVPTAEIGRAIPPEGVLEHVRHRGDRHTGLVRYQREKAAADRARGRGHGSTP